MVALSKSIIKTKLVQFDHIIYIFIYVERERFIVVVVVSVDVCAREIEKGVGL